MECGPGEKLGIYISIPFCPSKCTYCNFASGVHPATLRARYVERIVEDLRGARDWAGQMQVELPGSVDSVYLGGGTPSLLSPSEIAHIFSCLRSEFDLMPSAEITMECAPARLSDRTIAAMAKAGVNRVSLGVQSFVDAEAQSVGRRHTRVEVASCIERLRTAGIANINIDLIAGLPGQTGASWQESLTALLACGVPHASVYMLEIDEDSRLGRELLKGGKRYHAALVPSDDAIAAFYEQAVATLAAAGIAQYEISNFARPNAVSRHNLRYWERRPYLGVGLDASSMLRACEDEEDGDEPSPILRAATTCDLKEYLQEPALAETSWLAARQQHEEAWFLGLRLNRGVKLDALESEFGAALVKPARDVVRQLIEEELLAGDAGTVRLTNRGRLLSNEVFARFLGLEPTATR